MASDFAVSQVIPCFERAERQLDPAKPFVVGRERSLTATSATRWVGCPPCSASWDFGDRAVIAT